MRTVFFLLVLAALAQPVHAAKFLIYNYSKNNYSFYIGHVSGSVPIYQDSHSGDMASHEFKSAKQDGDGSECGVQYFGYVVNSNGKQYRHDLADIPALDRYGLSNGTASAGKGHLNGQFVIYILNDGMWIY